DIIIIMSTDRTISENIRREALALGFNEYNIIPCRVLRLFGFSFDKYKALKMNTPTIFAPSCWGGMTYNQLGLRFNSPFINMFENHDDYLKFLLNPQYYIDCKLQLKEMRFNNDLKRDFPVVLCDDILLYFNHYISFEEAVSAWERRKKRIDWNNLFVMFFDEDPQRVEKFCALPYENKICFVPYFEHRESVLSIEYRINDDMKKRPFWQIVNGMASGQWMYYDVFDLLLYNKITPIVKLKH
ncbi:MAG: DUF1919 domain-containing protein, partial [Eubacterium sp.]|nr:DUF1919 domain-containing protein [Eubacterium sp.]